MSLPCSFSNASAYFAAAAKFLGTHSWIYRESNTNVLNVLSCDMPLEFKDYFLELPNEQMNTFPFVHEELVGCPAHVQHFRQQLAELTPSIYSVNGSDVHVTNKGHQKRRVRMSPKKQHEIDKLAAHIDAYCSGSAVLLDLGSGLGYLSEALYELSPNYRILGLEADEKRVEAARQRCRQLLPQAATNAISYQQAYIGADSRALIEQHVAGLLEAAPPPQPPLSTMAIIGLHACADLSISAMLLFLKMPHVRSLHIMPCCYHKLALSDARGKASFVHFPLSAALKGALEAGAGAGAVNVHFNRPFLRLACQQTSARWRHTSALEHAIHGRQMFLRALAEGLRAENELLVRRKSKGGLTEALNFEDVQESYQLRLEETAAPLSWQSKHEQHFQEIMARFANGQGPRLAEALTCLQTAMQKLCENVVLFDRLCYLEEAAVAQGLSVRARYEQLLDEKLSPRCFVLVAEKLT